MDDQHRLLVEGWGFPSGAPVADLYTADGQSRDAFTELAAQLGSLRGGQLVVPARDAATELVWLVVPTGGAREE